MEASSDCIPCMLTQALGAARRVTDDTWLHRKLLFAVMEYLPTLNFDRSPAEVSYDCLHFTTRYLGVADPYADEKQLSTRKLLEIEHELRQKLLAAPDPLEAAIRYALAANRIDLGAVSEQQVEQELSCDATALEMAINDYDALRSALAEARTAIYILSNAGEVVCDKLVLEQLGVPEITCVVRQSPIINQVTRDDVADVGLERLARIVDPGVDALGIPLSLCSAEFRALFADADVVIARGQANYATLDEPERDVYHIFRAKCEHTAQHLGVRRDDAIVARTPRPKGRPLVHPQHAANEGDL